MSRNEAVKEMLDDLAFNLEMIRQATKNIEKICELQDWEVGLIP